MANQDHKQYVLHNSLFENKLKITSFQPCCRHAAIEAFQQGIFYLIGCDSCGTCFSITDDLHLFLKQAFWFHKINNNHPHTFDVAVYHGKIIFMFP